MIKQYTSNGLNQGQKLLARNCTHLLLRTSKINVLFMVSKIFISIAIERSQMYLKEVEFRSFSDSLPACGHCSPDLLVCIWLCIVY